MLSNQVEQCMVEAFRQARKTGHGHVTIEHLLLAILDTPEVCEILRACRCDPLKLKQQLEEHLVNSTPPRPDEAKGCELPPTFEVQPTLGLQRVLQRAVFHVQSSGNKKEVGVANVLVAIFSEKQSHAAYLLNQQNITRLDVVNYISHGLTPYSGKGPQAAMLTGKDANDFANHWVTAWNSHDLDEIMSHYSTDIVLVSPVAAKILNDPSGMVHGKEALRAYFRRGLEAYPNLKFELIDVMWGVSSVVLYYVNQKGTKTGELMEMDTDVKVIRVVANYND